MNTRLDLLDRLPKNSVGAELGVFRGDFSEEIVQRVKPFRLYLVDIWRGVMMSGDRNGENCETILDMESEMELVKGRFANNAEVQVVRASSFHWLKRNRGILDWVYIDTTHEYNQTMIELMESRAAVRDGGIISGHDYSPMFPGVVEAVDCFSQSHGLKMELTTEDKLSSFWIVNNR